MPVDFEALMASGFSDRPCAYTERDAMLYALGAGFAQRESPAAELAYVYEGRALRTVPTMAGVLLDSRFLAECGWQEARSALVEQRLELYRPLPPGARLSADRRIVAVLDHGRDDGVSVVAEAEVRMAHDSTVLFTLGSTFLLRGAGGSGGPEGTAPVPHKLPEREPDLVCELPTRAEQGLIFRLSGDRSALYADPKVAAEQGFRAVPLEDRCAAGVACRAVLRTICDYDFTLISGFDVAFRDALYPGEPLTTEMWQDGNIVSFRSVVRPRNAVVLDHGKCTLAT